MTEGYPVAGTTAVVEPRVLTPAETEQVDTLYAELKPAALKAANDYVMTRTPAALQEAMAAKVDVDFPPPPEADPAMMASRAEDLKSASRTASYPAT